MQRKILFISAMCMLLCANKLHAQFMHAIGLTISRVTPPSVFGSGNAMFPKNAFTYFPRYNIATFSNASISIGAPIGVGINFTITSRSNHELAYFLYDLPIVVDYNIGVKSTKENTSRWGGYMGAGFGYFHCEEYNIGYTAPIISYGPMIRAGVRIPPPARKGHPIMSVGIFLKTGLEPQKRSTLGVNILYELK